MAANEYDDTEVEEEMEPACKQDTSCEAGMAAVAVIRDEEARPSAAAPHPSPPQVAASQSLLAAESHVDLAVAPGATGTDRSLTPPPKPHIQPLHTQPSHPPATTQLPTALVAAARACGLDGLLVPLLTHGQASTATRPSTQLQQHPPPPALTPLGPPRQVTTAAWYSVPPTRQEERGGRQAGTDHRGSRKRRRRDASATSERGASTPKRERTTNHGVEDGAADVPNDEIDPLFGDW